MSEHQVEFSVPSRPLERADIVFVVRRRDPESGKMKQLGTLKVSKGSVVWFRGKTHINGEKMTWEEFDDLMSTNSRKRESR